ncbi:hypothetical protein SLEP1_g27880 [Rubroshorea leprosula]|uniref:Uncharacterized protein n=1 Tax=Rubroshorea leprosula TaxID=152421 RepID=A0AAV5K2M7_9ROSI|nr:hypothetical protein SLEP1_g27880 [Rubroshorea leprosula]
MASISIYIHTTCFARSRAQRHFPRRNPNSKFRPKRTAKYKRLSSSAPSSGGGGNVYVEVDAAMNSQLPFRNGMHFRTGRGGHGQERGHGGEAGAQDCDQRGREEGFVGAVVS